MSGKERGKSKNGSLEGIFITFEGTEGSGKSTLIRQLSQDLGEQGISVVCTREPGGSELAEKIRTLVLDNPMNPVTELFLYEASRSEHLVQIILPALQKGKIVLCDRFTDSTLAYQGHARGVPWKDVQKLNQIATLGIEPDLTVFLDIDPELGLRRAQDANRFEKEGVLFQNQVRKGFLKARSKSSTPWLTLKVREKSTVQDLSQSVIKYLQKNFKTLEKNRA